MKINFNLLKKVPLRNSFKQSSHVQHPCLHILGISHRKLKRLKYLYERIYIYIYYKMKIDIRETSSGRF